MHCQNILIIAPFTFVIEEITLDLRETVILTSMNYELLSSETYNKLLSGNIAGDAALCGWKSWIWSWEKIDQESALTNLNEKKRSLKPGVWKFCRRKLMRCTSNWDQRASIKESEFQSENQNHQNSGWWTDDSMYFQPGSKYTLCEWVTNMSLKPKDLSLCPEDGEAGNFIHF